jgi:hypothetical protein
MDFLGIGKAVMGTIDTVADKFFMDASQKKAFKLKALELQQKGEFKTQEIQLSAILAEAKSADPWTSRARPAFMWCFYIILLYIGIVLPTIGVFFPDKMVMLYDNVGQGFGAIPEGLWTTFTFGYLGYTGAREFGKTKLIGKK